METIASPTDICTEYLHQNQKKLNYAKYGDKKNRVNQTLVDINKSLNFDECKMARKIAVCIIGVTGSKEFS